MIIVGYPGIGKSTLAGRDHRFIDLESSNFKIEGERSEDWCKVYCKVAEDLSRQGYIVFVSSHLAVREALRGSRETVVAVFPSDALKDIWLAKLENRYHETRSEKDRLAFDHAYHWYDEDITALSNCDIPYKICLRNMDYDLEASIIHLINRELWRI